MSHTGENSGGTPRRSVVQDNSSRGNDTDLASGGAVKFDGDKPDMSLIPAAALRNIALVLMYGSKKYGRYNYLKAGGMLYSRLTGAAMRHITAFNNGEDADPETGLSHIAHAACCLAMLLDYFDKGKGIDNRYKEPQQEKEFKNEDDLLPGVSGADFDKLLSDIQSRIPVTNLPECGSGMDCGRPYR